MKKIKNRGFTLIELLAVIIILAIIALIATPVVLRVVDSAKESGRKSSVAGYADSVKLAINEKMFENNGSSPVINEEFLNSVDYQGSRVTCNETKNSNNYGVILKECKVEKSENVYCFAKGKVYSCEDEEFINIYNNINVNDGEQPGNQTGDQFENNYNVTKNVNKPMLVNGMTAIKWVDGVETTTTASDSDWYNYSQRQWANAKTQDGSYWVWIPRYAYKITSGWHTNTAGTFDIVFLKNNTNENSQGIEVNTTGYSATGTNTSNAYFLQPAFDGNNKYGFWVAKFEMSDSESLLKSVANVSPKTLNIGLAFTASQNMSTNTSYGWSSGTVDSHMVTNYEWGAISYLATSDYGYRKLTQHSIGRNNKSYYETGCGSSTATSAPTTECSSYASGGVFSSTTYNITGVYDMSGGIKEYTAAYINNNNTNLTTYGNSILTSTINKNIYSVTSDSQANNYEANKNIYGDAVYETSSSYSGATSWNGEKSNYPTSSTPWFIRSGWWNGTTDSGIFYFDGNSGEESSSANAGFRVTLSQI